MSKGMLVLLGGLWGHVHMESVCECLLFVWVGVHMFMSIALVADTQRSVSMVFL